VGLLALNMGNMPAICTEKSTYKILILNNPKIIKENKKNFIISFHTRDNMIYNAEFSNCYDKLIEYINGK